MGTYKNQNYSNPQRQRILAIRCSMIDRCTKPSCKAFKTYGGRGIKVCDEWLNDKESFYEWAISNGYADGLQIDRINTNGDYEPSNCRWITSKQNNNNRRDNVQYTINGETHTMSEWCDIYHAPLGRVHSRVYWLHWDIEKALTEKPQREIRLATINGVTKTVSQWADEIGIPRSTVFQRLKYGYSIEEALKKENFITNGNRTKRKIAIHGKYKVTLKEKNKDPE